MTYSNLEILKVLIVDDESAICETLKSYLENIGIHGTKIVDSGEKALIEMDKEEYNYVFLDLMMDGISGIETLKKIHRGHQLISVIIMTGYPSIDVVIDAMHNGAADFLVKPFRFQDIKIILEKIQKYRHLQIKNWLLNQELEGKKKVEELNIQLERKIRLQTILYNIMDSLSQINSSEEIYLYLVKKAIEFCNAEKACFMIFDKKDSSLIVLAQHGLDGIASWIKTELIEDSLNKITLDKDFVYSNFAEFMDNNITLDIVNRFNGLITIPFNIRGEPFGVLFVAQKEDRRSFDKEDEFILKFLAEKAALNIENIALYNNLKHSLMASLISLASAIEAKDPYTKQHSSRVTDMAIKIASQMRCNTDELEMLRSGGPIHDIGKIGINDMILNKPDRLTEDEFKSIKNHPIIGVNIISSLGLGFQELSIIRNHHERWDGKGYPDSLKEKDIPKLSRILAVADAFDAMSSNRAYRKALPFAVCIQELKNNSGTQFDPEVVEAALTVFVA